MLITYDELVGLVVGGVITAPQDQINAASIDVTLGSLFLSETIDDSLIDLSSKNRVDPWAAPFCVGDDEGVILKPGDFMLAHTVEMFNLPDTIAIEFKLKSSLARAGLDHSLAGWGDPGWHSSVLTLELRNNLRYHPLLLVPGMRIGQVVFWKGEAVPPHASYRNTGRYNNDTTVQPAK